jgi:hypothetical protein
MIAIENAIEETIKQMITRQLGSSKLVVRADEKVLAEDFERVVVQSKKSKPLCIDPSNYGGGLQQYEITVTYFTFAPHESANKVAESTFWEGIDAAIRSTDPTGLDLSRYSDFYVLPDSSSSTEIGHEGDRMSSRSYYIAVEEAPIN